MRVRLCDHGLPVTKCPDCKREYHRNYAKNVRRTHCSKGHELSGKRRRGGYGCETCGELKRLEIASRPPKPKPGTIKYHPGDRFGRLTLISRVRPYVWLVTCDCGVTCEKRALDVSRGGTKSCGRCGLVPRGGLSHRKARNGGGESV